MEIIKLLSVIIFTYFFFWFTITLITSSKAGTYILMFLFLVIFVMLYLYTKYSQRKNITTTGIQKPPLIINFGRMLMTTILVFITVSLLLFLFEKFKPAYISPTNFYYELIGYSILILSAYFIYRIRK